jgi:hypothetical protein
VNIKLKSGKLQDDWCERWASGVARTFLKLLGDLASPDRLIIVFLLSTALLVTPENG